MSGIAAVVQTGRGEPNQRNEALLRLMLDRMTHRSPAGSHVETRARASLGTCLFGRAAQQPAAVGAADDARRVRSIAADAKLDNRATLISELRLPAHFDGTDATLILLAYERWGPRCVERLYGDFAFAIVEQDPQRIFCARDPMGVRPLYYRVEPHRFSCASEITALLADPTVQPKPRLDSVALFLLDHFTNCGDTLYDGIQSLPPAHRLTVTPEATRLERYWRPDPWRRVTGTEDDYDEALRDTFAEVVRDHLRSEQSVGLCVSGGMDSSTVAGQVERWRRAGTGPASPATLLHVSFPGLSCDETGYSEAVAALWNLPSINTVPLEDPATTRPRVLMDHPELYYDPRWCMWLQLFGRARAAGIHSIFTGEGGDLCQEPSGYEAADALRGWAFRAAAEHGEISMQPRSWVAAARNVLLPLLPHGARSTLRELKARAYDQPFFAPRYRQLVIDYECRVESGILEHSAPTLSLAAQCANIEESMYHRILTTADLIAATSGVELRHPWLDRRLIELMLAMPAEQRYFRNGRVKPKPLMRRALAHLVPTSVATAHDAAAYGPYMSQALFDAHAGVVQGLFRESRLVELGVISADALNNVQPTATMLISNAVAMELWLRHVYG